MSKYVFDKQKWQNLTIFEQMGNIGSEVGRAFAARRRGDTAAMTGAWQRGSCASANYSPAWRTNRWRITLCGLRWRREGIDNKTYENHQQKILP